MKKQNTKTYPIYVLCLEDDIRDAEFLQEMLHDSGFLVKMDIVSHQEHYISSLKANNYDIILADYTVPGFGAPDALKQAILLRPDVPFICVSGTIGEDTAVELLKQGATDYVLKDRIGRLSFAVQRALEGTEIQKDWKMAQAKLHEKEVEIKESELRYKYMFQNNPQPMWIYDLNTLNFLEVNHAAIKHYGYSREEFLSMTLKDIRPKEDIHALLKDIELTSKAYNSAGEWRHLKKNGELMYVEIVSHSIVYGKIKARHVMVTDITSRKSVESALRESEEQLKAIFENSINPIVVADDAGNYFKVNQAAAQMFQYPVEQLLQMNVGDLHTTTSLDAAARYQAYISKGFEIGEFDITHPDGTETISQYHAVRVRENFNLSILSDITERKHAEDELIKLSRAVEQSPVSILITDKNGNIEYVNTKALSLTGYEFKELKGKNPRIFSSGEKPKEEYRILWETILTGKEWRVELLNKKKNGELYWEFASISAIKSKMGEITHFLAVKEDITERKQAEEKLKLLNCAVEASSVSIVITDSEGNIMYTNPWFTQITGYPSEEVIGRKMRILNPGKLSESDSEALWSAIQSGKDWSGEYQNRKKNGELYWEKVIISPIMNTKDDIGNFVAINEDITYRRQAEETQKQLEVAQKTAKFRQDFLAKMSHEIRTPLAGLLGMMDVLEQTCLTQEQVQYMLDMKVSGENIKEIINMVLDYSKIEAGKVSLKPDVFEFKTLLQDAKVLFRDRLSAGVELIVDIDPQIPPFLKADKLRLSQLINNFVSNAIKFTQQGSITLRACLEEAGNTHQPMVVKIEICDTGIGISESLQAKLFNPFVQSEEGERAKYEGTGLGLSICKELVGLMQGEIGVKSIVGEGSIFWFTFSAERAEEIMHLQLQTPAAEPLGKIRVLVAEDMFTLQKVTRLLLESKGHKVQLANNGQHALELFEPGWFDLILMDINMPVMDGITATRLLKEKYTDLPPIVGLSANALEGDREKYLALGMDEYLVKPFNLADFNRLVSRLHISS